ncbi:MAG: alkaline phosphatase family protein [Verrucomicrobiales bacterium]
MPQFFMRFLLGITFIVSGARGAQVENVFLITLDGLRRQEVFSGAEAALISSHGGVQNTNALAKQFWRENAKERREVLMPFFWQVIAKEGQLFGNRELGSNVRVTNGKNFTYPGFNEILTGFADERIDKNAKILNENVTVFEWLHQKPAFKGKVAAFANWDVFPYIMNASRAGIPIWTSYPEGTLPAVSPGMQLVNAIAGDMTPVWEGMTFDVLFYHAAREYTQAKKPRLVWIAFSETDEWAHEGRYDLYLQAARKIDDYIKGLWDLTQSLPEYKGKTAFIITTDHGRGTGLKSWRDHGANVAGAEEIWIAAIGPAIPPHGEREGGKALGQDQVAATIALWLGEDYNAATAQSGKPIGDLIKEK